MIYYDIVFFFSLLNIYIIYIPLPLFSFTTILLLFLLIFILYIYQFLFIVLYIYFLHICMYIYCMYITAVYSTGTSNQIVHIDIANFIIYTLNFLASALVTYIFHA